MKKLNYSILALMFSLFLVTILNVNYTYAGYQNDPIGDAGGIGACDITKINIDVTYRSHPTNDEVILKITLLEQISINESNNFNWFDYNFYIDTSLSLNTNTSELTDEIYEYRAHLGRKWTNGVWTNTSSLFATRYYYTGDGSGKTMGAYYWNPNTMSWQTELHDTGVGEVIGNTIVWDVTGAIHREQPIGTGYVIQGVATAAYNLEIKDVAPPNGWVTEFTNMCGPGPSRTTNTLPSIGICLSLILIGTLTLSSRIRKHKK